MSRRGRLLGLLVILAVVASAAFSPVRADQAADLEQKLKALEAKAQACGQDPVCLQKVAQEMQELVKGFPPSGQAQVPPPPAVAAAVNPKDPCAPVEQFKAQVRAHYKVEPTWVRCRPVQVRLTWEVNQLYQRPHLPEATDKVSQVLVEEFPAYLATYHDPHVKGQLNEVRLLGPSPEDQVQRQWSRLEARISLKDRAVIFRGQISLKGGKGFVFPTPPVLGLSWFRTREAEVEIASSGVLLDDSALSLPAGLRPVAPTVGFLDNQHFRVKLRGEKAFSPAELKELLESGRLSKTYKVEDRLSYPGPGTVVARHTIDGRVTVEVGLEVKDELLVSPAEGFTSSGPDEAGRFIPEDKTYVLKNTGDKPLDFTASKTSPWLDVSPATGRLEAGQSLKVTAALNEKTQKLEEGEHKDKIAFANATSGRGSAGRDVAVTVGPEQRWQVTVKGWEREVVKPVTSFQDSDGSTKSLVKAVKFHWELTGQFRLKKGKQGWYYHDGSVTSAKLTPKSDFSPADAYDCQVKSCPGKATVKTLVGAPIVGNLVGGKVKLNWYSMHPAACLECQPQNPSLPQAPYEGFFESTQFLVQVALEWHPLKSGYSQEFPKGDWLLYRLSLKKLK